MAASDFAAVIEAVAPGPEGPAARMALIADDESDTDVELPIRAMAEAQLVLTEDLIRAALRREKAALKDAKRPGRARGSPPPRRSPAVASRNEIERLKAAARGAAAKPLGPDEGETMAVSANRLELLQIVDAVAREKSIDRSIVLASMEDAMQKAARSRYGQETEVRAEINPKTGEIRFSRLLLVVDEVENDATQITLAEAQKKNPSAQIGDWIAESLPPFDYGRIPAQASKQVLVQKIREAERDKQYDVYKDRIGEIINGQVKRVEYGNVVVDLGGAGAGEAVVRRDELIPREMFRPGDRIRAYVYDVRREARGPQIFLPARIRSSPPSCSPRKCRKSTTASSR